MGALLFNAGCNEQVFPPKPWKNSRFREKRKKRAL